MFSPAINMHKNYDINYTKKENGDEKYGERKKHKSQLSAKDIQLLYMIYQLRAVTYEQFKKLGNYTSKFYYYHKVQKFVRLGIIYKETITGSYQEGKRHQGNYVGITESGLSLLKEKDYKI